jgi:hypothetical protein
MSGFIDDYPKIRQRLRLFTILFLYSLSFSALSQTKAFGDEVAECAAKYGLPLNSPKLQEVFSICEKEVEQSRTAIKTNTPTAVESFLGCLNESAVFLDDYISPASEIAQVVAAECRNKWFSVVKSSNAPPSEWITNMEAYTSNTVKDSALRAVLINRRNKASTAGKVRK